MGADKVILGFQSVRQEKYCKILGSDIKHKGRYACTKAYNKL